ncbi:unnamed protein product [Urochloa decumbens]|uniref:Transmembrane protein n=1 Tax=Urochloa decumbens TaxID=240449 RepID=A0ABC8YS75_9POAL
MSRFGRARRFSFWFLALLFHTMNALLYAIKMEADQWCLWTKISGSVMTLVLCIGLFVILGRKFPITKDVLISAGIIGTFYVPTAVVSMRSSSSWSAVVLGIIHILITLLMHILRFSCQEGFRQFEDLPFKVALLGIFGALLTFVPDYSLSAYKTAALIGLLFRLFDVIFILGGARDTVNRFLEFRISWLLARSTY